MGFAAAMIYKISDNIYSPLGTTTEENFDAVMSGRSALGTYSGRWDIPVPFCASLFDDDEAGAKGNLTPAPSPRERGGDDGEDGMIPSPRQYPVSLQQNRDWDGTCFPEWKR